VKGESYNLDYSKIKRITFSSVKYYTYSIPFKESEDELVIITNNNSISFVISQQITLTNGNKKFLVNNYKNQPLMSLEQNVEGKIGNRKLFKNDNSSFESKSLFPLVENNYLAKESGCAGLNSFSGCMQCMWDECSSSWVCGAVLALEPGPTIAFAAALCGLDTLANAK
jgi:hypothetical protein